MLKIKCNRNDLYERSEIVVKGARARLLGWKVLILKYDLGKSLSKGMWCKMADTKKMFDCIFKKMKNAFNMR